LPCRNVNGEGFSHTIPTDVRIPLRGLTIDLLDAATKDKSQWIRKVPMRLTFEECTLPYSEHAFVFFASNAAEKEQWCDRCHRQNQCTSYFTVPALFAGPKALLLGVECDVHDGMSGMILWMKFLTWAESFVKA
jgi:hypothetical protein